jgi:hypothetical protein
MARCGCSGASCSCVITGGGGVTVSGAGSAANPYLIVSDIGFDVADTATLNLTRSGDGSPANPWVISGVVTVTLDNLTDVSTSVATVGYVLARQGDGSFAMVPPSTAPAGAINVGDGLTGDGSAGNKLRVLLAPSSGLVVGPTGLAMAGGGAWTPYTPVWGAPSTAPSLGNGSLKGFYSQTGKTVNVSIELIFGSTSTRGVGNYNFTLPVAPASNRRQIMALHVGRYGVADYTGIANIFSGRIDRLVIATSTAGQYVSHSLPATMPASSLIAIEGTYEAA